MNFVTHYNILDVFLLSKCISYRILSSSIKQRVGSIRLFDSFDSDSCMFVSPPGNLWSTDYIRILTRLSNVTLCVPSSSLKEVVHSLIDTCSFHPSQFSLWATININVMSIQPFSSLFKVLNFELYPLHFPLPNSTVKRSSNSSLSSKSSNFRLLDFVLYGTVCLIIIGLLSSSPLPFILLQTEHSMLWHLEHSCKPSA